MIIVGDFKRKVERAVKQKITKVDEERDSKRKRIHEGIIQE